MNTFLHIISNLLLYPSSIRGITIHVDGDEVEYIHKSGIRVFNKLYLNEINSNFNKSFLKEDVVISITSNKVLSKIININEENTQVESYYPGINVNDFHIQLIEGKDYAVLSIIRKEILDKYLEPLKLYSNQICEIVLGPFNIHEIFLSPIGNYSFTYNGKLYEYFEHKLINISNTDNDFVNFSHPIKYKQLINEENLISISAIASYTFTRSFSIKPLFKDIFENKQKAKYSFLIRKAITFSVLILSSILVLNSIFYRQLELKFKNALDIKKANQIIQLENDSLNKLINTKQNIIETFVLKNTLPTSYIIDRLASSVPESISLSSIRVFSIKQEAFSDSLLIDKSHVSISGYAESKILNEWVIKLKSLGFVKNIVINSFKAPNNRSKDNFSLKLLLNAS